MELAVLNTTSLTHAGQYDLTEISLNDARGWVRRYTLCPCAFETMVTVGREKVGPAPERHGRDATASEFAEDRRRYRQWIHLVEVAGYQAAKDHTNHFYPDCNGPEGIKSVVGHESTARILTELLGVDVPVNRSEFVQQPGQPALVFKLRTRPPEGAVLDRDQVETIGYDFMLLRRMA